MDITGMIDRAKARLNTNSDRELARELGLSPPTVHLWRNDKAKPSDDSMAGLAELAGVDPLQAVLELREQTAHGQAKEIYREIARRLAGIAAAVMVMIGVSLPANATGTEHHLIPGNIHYATIAYITYAADVGTSPTGALVIAK